MAHAKYIKRGDKTYGPYFYKSVREKDGRVTKIYLGTELKKEKKYNSWLILAIILFVGSVLFIFGLKYTGYTIYSTNNVSMDINMVISKDAFITVNDVAQPIPLELTEINGSFYYDIKDLSFNFDNGQYNISLIDNGTIVFNETVDVNSVDSQEEGDTTKKDKTDEEILNEIIQNNSSQENITSAIQDTTINQTNESAENNLTVINVTANIEAPTINIQNNAEPLVIEETVSYGDVEINKPVIWTKRIKANKNVNSVLSKIRCVISYVGVNFF